MSNRCSYNNPKDIMYNKIIFNRFKQNKTISLHGNVFKVKITNFNRLPLKELNNIFNGYLNKIKNDNKYFIGIAYNFIIDFENKVIYLHPYINRNLKEDLDIYDLRHYIECIVSSAYRKIHSNESIKQYGDESIYTLLNSKLTEPLLISLNLVTRPLESLDKIYIITKEAEVIDIK